MKMRRTPPAKGRMLRAKSLAENIVRGGRPAKQRKARKGLRKPKDMQRMANKERE